MNTTIEKNSKILRGFLKWAKINGHNKNMEYETFRPKFDGLRNRDRVVVALDWQELMAARIKASGKIDRAIMQAGRKIVIDAALALELFGEKGKKGTEK